MKRALLAVVAAAVLLIHHRCSASPSTGTVDAVYELLDRVLPSGVPSSAFLLTVDDVGPGDTFTLSNVAQGGDAGTAATVAITGSTIPALTAGVGWCVHWGYGCEVGGGE